MGIFNLLSKDEKETLEILIKFFRINGIRAYLIGGAVRDGMLNVKPKDIDICVEVELIDFIKNIPNVKNIKYYSKFGTSTLEFYNGIKIDIIRCRKEKYEYYGALPIVKPSNIVDDILRRDFTINSLAYDLIEDKLLDICGGMKDIDNKCIRTLTSFSYFEDPTRIFRAVRYSGRYKFTIIGEEQIRNCLRKGVLSSLSNDRIIKEMLLISKEDNWVEMCKICNRIDLIKFNLNFLGRSNYLYNYDNVDLRICNIYLSTEDLRLKEAIENNSVLPREIKEGLKKFKPFAEKLSKCDSNYQIYDLLKNLNEIYFMVFAWDRKLIYKVINYKNMQNLKMNIKAKDIMDKGFKEGKIIGYVLNYIKKVGLNMNMPLSNNYFINNIGEILHGIENKNK
ncbi:CCA tRNA nucleotidyltransferase [Haloimpatiens sp. FM7315]|uniref:CCA tRNA nucleotidyltransferase n=1 Tax=Haloimpatiens sp. FM7315 TaxID=3298609 RepID=UPI0035A3030D